MKKAFFVLLALAATSTASNAATAYWTGRMEQAQSVTFKMGWNCEYSYAGRNFWAFFTGTCPSSIEIE